MKEDTMTRQHWPTYLSSAQRNTFVPDRFAPPLRLMWKFELGSYVWGGPIIVDDIVYLLNGLLYALSLDTGELRWISRDWGAVGDTVAPTFWHGRVVAYGIGGIFIVEAATGILQRHIASASAVASPCVYHDMVYWSTMTGGFLNEGELLAADLHTGALQWQYHLDEGYRWTPSAHHNRVYCANLRGVYAFDAAVGTLHWHWPLENDRNYPELLKRPQATAVLVEDDLFVAIESLGLVALDARTGADRWICDLSTRPLSTPSIAGDVVYLTHGPLQAVDRATGQPRWAHNPRDKRYSFTNSQPIIVGDHLYIGGGHRRFIYGFDRHTGEQVWAYPTGDLVFSTPAYANGRLVIGSHDGFVYCFEQA
jgi:outer membrane protein assembly factor BamB